MRRYQGNAPDLRLLTKVSCVQNNFSIKPGVPRIYLSTNFASVPQTCRATAKPLRVSSRSLSPFGLEILTSQLNGSRFKYKTLYFY